MQSFSIKEENSGQVSLLPTGTFNESHQAMASCLVARWRGMERHPASYWQARVRIQNRRRKEMTEFVAMIISYVAMFTVGWFAGGGGK